MRVSVDRKRCEGYGLCERSAPEVFALDEKGELIAKYEGRDLPAELQPSAEEAVRVCPVAALTIEPPE
jgi:ferredoxin